MSLEINNGLRVNQKTISAAGIAMRFFNSEFAVKKGADYRLLTGFRSDGHGKDVAVCPRVGFSFINAIWQQTLASTWFWNFLRLMGEVWHRVGF